MERSFSIGWYLTGQVLYARLHHQLEGDEPEQFDKMVCEHLNEGEAIHLIMDLRDIREMKSPSVARLDHAVSYRRHPHLQWIIFLTNDQLMRFLTSTVSQMAHKSYFLFSDVDDLNQFLQRHLPEADWEHTLIELSP
ncbi:MAG: hypothetical protein K8I60_16515 [Anaerolineae bacterium]|nr:hypothetical protein [Anaerolineae bacterium]